jgi:hypothetical protein
LGFPAALALLVPLSPISQACICLCVGMLGPGGCLGWILFCGTGEPLSPPSLACGGVLIGSVSFPRTSCRCVTWRGVGGGLRGRVAGAAGRTRSLCVDRWVRTSMGNTLTSPTPLLVIISLPSPPVFIAAPESSCWSCIDSQRVGPLRSSSDLSLGESWSESGTVSPLPHSSALTFVLSVSLGAGTATSAGHLDVTRWRSSPLANPRESWCGAFTPLLDFSSLPALLDDSLFAAPTSPDRRARGACSRAPRSLVCSVGE